jgi:hypothetical protein
MIPIKNDLCLSEPFVDYLNISTPKDNQESLLKALRPYFDVCGMSEVVEGLFRMSEGSGTAKAFTRANVAVFGSSGAFLQKLRDVGLYHRYLAEFAEFEHRISMMHVTCDFSVDSPKLLKALSKTAFKGDIALTRKSIQKSHVNFVQSLNPDGLITGTVYLGNRANSDVWAKVYDKRAEVFARSGLDGPERIRVEIAVQSDVGSTLRDASRPLDIFYHFASKTLVTPHPNALPWHPHAEGFDLPPKQELTAHERLRNICDFSLDISRMFDLAVSEYGDQATDEVIKIIKRRFERIQNSVL